MQAEEKYLELIGKQGMTLDGKSIADEISKVRKELDALRNKPVEIDVSKVTGNLDSLTQKLSKLQAEILNTSNNTITINTENSESKFHSLAIFY